MDNEHLGNYLIYLIYIFMMINKKKNLEKSHKKINTYISKRVIKK
jgi:hypothetical protein